MYISIQSIANVDDLSAGNLELKSPTFAIYINVSLYQDNQYKLKLLK